MTDTRTQHERMLAGDLYIADDPQIFAAAQRAHTLMHQFNHTDPTDPARRAILNQLIPNLHPTAEIRAPLYVDYGTNITVGPGTFLNFGCVLLDVAPITIGADVQIATNVQLLTPTHPLDAAQRRAKWEAAKPITLGDNVWLGGGVIVLPGVTIGENTVVGAGAVVTKDLPPNVLAVGNPARIIREL